VTADSGKQGCRKAVALPPDLSKEGQRGQRGQRRLVHNSIIGILWFIAIELKQIFYSFIYYFWGQHCCWTVASIIGKDFLFFINFHCPQLFYCPPSPIDVPASLHNTVHIYFCPLQIATAHRLQYTSMVFDIYFLNIQKLFKKIPPKLQFTCLVFDSVSVSPFCKKIQLKFQLKITE